MGDGDARTVSFNAWRGFHSFPPSFSPSFNASLMSGVSPVASAIFTSATYATNLAALNSLATFSRAGLATQFDSSGYLTYGPNNLLTYSNTFSNAAWLGLSAGSSVASSTIVTQLSAGTAPDGVHAASTLAVNAGGISAIKQDVTIPANGVVVFYVKASASGAASNVRVTTNNGVAWGTGVSTKLALTGSWQPIIVAGPVSAGGTVYRIHIGNIDVSGGVDTTCNGNVDIAQAAASAVTYETTPRTADQVITTSAAYYGPRFDYTYNGSSWVPAGLLVEGAATNSTYPSTGALSGGNWSLTFVTYPSTTVGIDGVAGSAAKAVINSGTSATTAYAISTTASNTGVVSAYAKPAGYNYLVLVRGIYASGDYAIFDVNAGTVVVSPTFAGSTAVMKQYGAFWLCELRSAQNITISAFSVSPAANISATSNGTDGVYVTEFQTELGATAASSRIRTSASAVTRPAETVQGTTYSAVSGSIIAEWDSAYTANGGGAKVFAFSPVAVGKYLALSTDGQATGWYASGPGAVSVPSGATVKNRGGFSYDSAGRFSAVYNGGTVLTSNSSDYTGGATTLNFGQQGGSAQFLNGHLRSFAIYNSRLPDATLQAKSVVGAAY